MCVWLRALWLAMADNSSVTTLAGAVLYVRVELVGRINYFPRLTCIEVVYLLFSLKWHVEQINCVLFIKTSLIWGVPSYRDSTAHTYKTFV